MESSFTSDGLFTVSVLLLVLAVACLLRAWAEQDDDPGGDQGGTPTCP